MTWRPSASRIWAMPPPSTPTIIGSTTVSANSDATAASMALPPASSISEPAADASGWLVTTIPRDPVAGRFSQVNVAMRGGTGEITFIVRFQPFRDSQHRAALQRHAPNEVARLARLQQQDSGLLRELALPAERARHAEPGLDAEEGRA